MKTIIMITLLGMSGAALLSAAIAVVIAFAILAGIFWAVGYFGFPQAQKIVGLICLVIWVLYALQRFGFLGSVQM